jgi:hypothetical protein
MIPLESMTTPLPVMGDMVPEFFTVQNIFTILPLAKVLIFSKSRGGNWTLGCVFEAEFGDMGVVCWVEVTCLSEAAGREETFVFFDMFLDVVDVDVTDCFLEIPVLISVFSVPEVFSDVPELLVVEVAIMFAESCELKDGGAGITGRGCTNVLYKKIPAETLAIMRMM